MENHVFPKIFAEGRHHASPRRHLLHVLRLGADKTDQRLHISRSVWIPHRPKIRQQPRTQRRNLPSGRPTLLRPQNSPSNRQPQATRHAQLEALRRRLTDRPNKRHPLSHIPGKVPVPCTETELITRPTCRS